MNKVSVSTKRPYSVLIGSDILSGLGDAVLSVHKLSKAVIVTDDNVAGLYLDDVINSLTESGFRTSKIIIKSGEENKTASTYLSVIEQMAQCEIGREDLVVALGGGVVGDVAGFAAATYMRGIDIIQVPTTLLSAIDASVGGKTGVDLQQGKNLLGAFHQPVLVYFDSKTLTTLSELDFKNGIGEGIKYAILCGGEILDILEKGLCEDNILRFVELAVSVKRDIVEEDEGESGKRKLLNLGHTFGHAIEKLSEFSMSHGIAVAKGIYIVARASLCANKLTQVDYEIICELFKKYGLDTACNYTTAQLLSVIKMDKKINSDGQVSLVDIRAIGKCEINKMSFENLKEYINECKN